MRKADLEAPHETYLQRLKDHQSALLNLDGKESLLGNARIVIFLTRCLAAWMAFAAGWFADWWLAVAVGAFLMILPLHDRVRRDMARTKRAIGFCERGLARLEERWIGQGEPGTRFLDETHPYAPDLDLFGKGSLFE